MTAAAKYPPPRRTTSTGQGAFDARPVSQALTPRAAIADQAIQERTQDLLAEFREGFRQITPALILTGIAIGIASGLGSTVGTAVGTYFVGRFTRRSGAK